MSNKEKYALTGYESRILMNLDKSEADKLTDKKMIAATLKQFLNTDIDYTLNGAPVKTSLANLLVAKKIDYDLNHPSEIDLEKYAKVLGEQKLEATLNLKTADDLFGDIVNK